MFFNDIIIKKIEKKNLKKDLIFKKIYYYRNIWNLIIMIYITS